MNKIQSIINDYFDFDFFWKQDSQKKQLIKNLAKDFQNKHPNAIVNIIHQVKAAYPALTIKRYTYFIEDNRCLTFEIQFPNQDNVVGAISIFGYFLAWNSMPGKSGFDKYIYENDNAILNQLFRTIVNPEFGNMLEWVSKDMISEEIEIFNHDKIHGVGDDSPYIRRKPYDKISLALEDDKISKERLLSPAKRFLLSLLRLTKDALKAYTKDIQTYYDNMKLKHR